MKWRLKTILFKPETTEGTDPTPTGAANAMEVENMQINPIAGRVIQRSLDLPYLGARKDDLVDKHVVVSFDVGVAGGGAAGTAPPWGVLHRCCGFGEVIDDGVDVRYSPVSSAHESGGCYVYIDGVLHKSAGGRGNVSVRMPASDYPRLSYRFLGLFRPVTAAASPAVTMTAWQPVLPVGLVNTPTFSLAGHAARMRELMVDIGNDVQGRFLVGYEGIRIVDRAATGRVNIEAPPLATKDYFALAAATPRGSGVLQCIHGTTAGNIVEIGAPVAEIGQPEYTNDQGEVHLNIPLGIKPDAGNDELTFIVR